MAQGKKDGRCLDGVTNRGEQGGPAESGRVTSRRRRLKQLKPYRVTYVGLHLHFYTDEEGRRIARFRPRPEHQGYPGHLHGGLISSLLDVPTQISAHFGVLAV
jgi:acyl-coenzyme A thioesterase PaaI-like protein